jgi:hypothetical protein
MHCKGDRDEGKIVALAAFSLLWSASCSGPRCTGLQEPSHAVLVDGGSSSSSSAAANPATHLLPRARRRRPGSRQSTAAWRSTPRVALVAPPRVRRRQRDLHCDAPPPPARRHRPVSRPLAAAWRSLRLLLHELGSGGGAFTPTPTSSRSVAPVWLAPVDGCLAKPSAAPPRACRQRRGFHPDPHLLALGNTGLARRRRWWPGGAPSRSTRGHKGSLVASLVRNDGSPQLPAHGAHRRQRRPPAACSPQPPPPRIPLRRPCDCSPASGSACGGYLRSVERERAPNFVARRCRR